MGGTWTTAQLPQAASPLEQIIGQDEAVRIARVAAKQKRHLLLVGPPGTGKSMIAQAIASIIPKPAQEIVLVHNPQEPQKPIVEIKSGADAGEHAEKEIGSITSPAQVPFHVSVKLGFRCNHCGTMSKSTINVCPACGYEKFRTENSPFDDLVAIHDSPRMRHDRVRHAAYRDGVEEVLYFERAGPQSVRVLTEKQAREKSMQEQKKHRKVLIPLKRNSFIMATGASEAELLGDVMHDPYGGHPEVGILPYLRVVPGAVHEAHEGVLFIDELGTLGHLQRYLLTAMQEKKFTITGRNASSTGATVRAENVPCDFIFVSAVNINDLPSILAPLRSRISGSGYEVLFATHMPKTEENKAKLFKFIAQEIRKDGHIPHADLEACEAIAHEAHRRAAAEGNTDAYTLRLRHLSGIIKIAGDIAASHDAQAIAKEDVAEAISKSKTVEEQISSQYGGSWWKAGMSDYGAPSPAAAKKDEREIR
ncbi:MAG: ATP-binding protein [Candidatus Micrarchaeia archaeon]